MIRQKEVGASKEKQEQQNPHTLILVQSAGCILKQYKVVPKFFFKGKHYNTPFQQPHKNNYKKYDIAIGY